jgi:phosphinothricin acetyltransferase
MMHIRSAVEADAERILSIYRPYVEHTAISFESSLPSLDEMKQRISKIAKSYPWLVYEEQNRILGYAYASQFRERVAYQWSAEVSVYVHQDCLKQGVGRKLYRQLLDDLQEARFTNAIGVIALPNEASVALHRAMGFESVGTLKKIGLKFGVWHDVELWQKSFKYWKAPLPPDGF